jgi:prophage DNA circulation protein
MSGLLGGLFTGITQTAARMAGVGEWYNLLRHASFRGIPFHVEQGTATSGRRAALHEYPGRDVPYTEDLGRKQYTYQFTAYVIGQLYPIQRDALLKACTLKGPGTLVHPSFGAKQVVCTDVAVTEERQSGNYAAFSMTFAEAGQLMEPAATKNTANAIAGSAASATSATASGFSKIFSVVGEVESTVTSALDDVKTFLDDTASLVLSPLNELGNTLGINMVDLGLNAETLIYNAPALAMKVAGVTGAYGASQAASPVVAGMMVMGSMFSSRGASASAAKSSGAVATLMNGPAAWAAPIPVPISRQREALNGAAFQRLVRESALVEVAYAVPGLDLQSSQEALNLRVALADSFDAAQTAAANAGLDDSYSALVNLENEVIAHLTQRMLQLPALVTYRMPQSPNSIALAWRLYQDANRGDEIVARVNAVNPSFLPRSGRVLSS